MTNIFVGNLSFHSTEHEIRGLFEQFGIVDRVNVVTDRETGRARGFAFVEMSVGAEAAQAINNLNGYALDGRSINVNEARPREERGSNGGGYGQRQNNYGGQRRNRY
jgi:cold-inducible RNA-binding protein